MTLRDALAVDEACRALHIHVAEQPAEVADCMACFGRPSVDLLLDRDLPDSKRTLVHGTHATQAELDGLCDRALSWRSAQRSRRIWETGVSKRPQGFCAAGGRLAIGSDSNVCCNACRELRLFEWSQRLLHWPRNVLASPSEPSVADAPYHRALSGGWRGLGKLDSSNPAGSAFIEKLQSGSPAHRSHGGQDSSAAGRDFLERTLTLRGLGRSSPAQVVVLQWRPGVPHHISSPPKS